MAPALGSVTPLKWLVSNDLVAIPALIAAEAAILFLVDALITGSKFGSVVFAGIILGAALFAFRANLAAMRLFKDQQISSTGEARPLASSK
jgi:hypothetical protein